MMNFEGLFLLILLLQSNVYILNKKTQISRKVARKKQNPENRERDCTVIFVDFLFNLEKACYREGKEKERKKQSMQIIKLINQFSYLYEKH
jgi:hypothetical protein